METGVSAAPATVAAGWSSPSYKKARMSWEQSKLGETDHADPSKLEWERQICHGEGAGGTCELQNLVPVRKVSQGMLVPVSSHDAATAAKSAAAQAFKVAMAAKENASAKASAAVKAAAAAAAAKRALEAAACAARAVAHAQAELQRKTASAEYRLAESSPKRQLVAPESQKEKMVWWTNVKV
jgi:hypothetical protein